MRLRFEYKDIDTETTDKVRRRLEQGSGCIVVGRPGTGKTHAVRKAADADTVWIHSYVVHYKHWNRWRAGERSRDLTLAGFREAIKLWPQNALWWQREAELLLEAGRFNDAVGRVELAYQSVEAHPNAISSCACVRPSAPRFTPPRR